MKRLVDPFTVFLPKLDLHGEYAASTKYLVDEFINDNIKMGNSKILIIHGKGTGVLKSIVHETLKHHKSVKKYYLDGANDGQTIVEVV